MNDRRDSGFLEDQNSPLHQGREHAMNHQLYQDKSKVISLYSSNWKIIPINGIGFVDINALLTEIKKLESITTRAKIDIALGVIHAHSITDPNSEEETKFLVVAPINESRKCLKLLIHHQNGSDKIKRFGNKSGIVNMNWPGGRLTSPYIRIDGMLYIPSKFVNKMNLKGTEFIHPIQLPPSKRAHLLLEILDWSPDLLNSFKNDHETTVVGIETIQRTTGAIILTSYIED